MVGLRFSLLKPVFCFRFVFSFSACRSLGIKGAAIAKNNGGGENPRTFFARFAEEGREDEKTIVFEGGGDHRRRRIYRKTHRRALSDSAHEHHRRLRHGALSDGLSLLLPPAHRFRDGNPFLHRQNGGGKARAGHILPIPSQKFLCPLSLDRRVGNAVDDGRFRPSFPARRTAPK